MKNKSLLKELRGAGFTRQEFKLKFNWFAGLYFAWFFLKLGFNHLQVTYMWLIIKLIAVILLLKGTYGFIVIGIILYNLIVPFMDGADGHMFRYLHKGKKSVMNFFLDNLGHLLFIPLFYVCLGIGIYNSSGQVIYPIIGASTAIIFLISHCLNKDEFLGYANIVKKSVSNEKRENGKFNIKRLIGEFFEIEYPFSIMFFLIMLNLAKLALILYFILTIIIFILRIFSMWAALNRYDKDFNNKKLILRY